jgi:predicted Zn-ribbon and HTH transcriptional regulator
MKRYTKYERVKKFKCKNPDCGLEFKTEGKPSHCPRCHSVLEYKK